MLHYTLNTGHTRVSPRREIADDVIPVVRPLLEPGEHELPNPPGYILRVPMGVVGFFATIYRGPDIPLASIAVAATDEEADELWPNVEKHYHSLTEIKGLRSADFKVAKRPEKTPWVAAVLIFGTAEEMFWIADFERCLAWAYMESKQ